MDNENYKSESYWKEKYLKLKTELEYLKTLNDLTNPPIWDEDNHIIIKYSKEQLDKISTAKAEKDSLKLEIRDCIEIGNLIDWSLNNFNALEVHDIEYFILNKPLEKIGGDLVFSKLLGDKIFIFLTDPVGHGLYSQMLNLLIISIINDVLSENSLLDRPVSILSDIDKKFHKILRKIIEEEHYTIGCDIGLSIIDLKKKTFTYAGTRWLPIYLKRRNFDWIKLKGDNFYIGGKPFIEKELSTVSIFELEEIESVYISSDGIVDQFGGLEGKKLKNVGYKELLERIHNYPINQQNNLIEEYLNDWMSQNKELKIKQMDDILVFGMKFKTFN